MKKLQSKIQSVRWKIADWLSFLACKLRGHKWYLGRAWHAVPGNRATDLQQSIWQRCVCLDLEASNNDADLLENIEAELDELAQLAGENWGHITPKVTQDAAAAEWDAEYQKFWDDCAKQCRCPDGVCGGVLQGGLCDTPPDKGD
jgi:hypothetical protein